MEFNPGDLVWIDLTSGRVRRSPYPEDICRQYLGGRGLAAYLLLRYLGREVEPLDPDNILIISVGLLSGTPMITSSRAHFSARSPLTGLIGSSNGGGHFASELSACGIQALIITGKAEEPVYLEIVGERIVIREVSSLWGMTTGETVAAIRELMGEPRARVAVIGPAGEKLSNLASVMTDQAHFAGRTGIGAVFGSKNLKGIAVKRAGSFKNCSLRARQAIDRYVAALKAVPDWEIWTTVGTSTDVSWTDRMGASGAKNYSQVKFEGVATACGSSYRDLPTSYRSCFRCPIHCRATIKVNRGRHNGLVADRGEYEPLSSWGPRCGNADVLESVYLCKICDDYGIDNMGTGNVIAFAMDLFERGILTKEDTGGLELTWGNAGAMEQLLHQICTRSSWLGDTLAQGMAQAARIIGRGAEQYAYTVKGLSISIMDPRGFKATGLGYAICNRGGDFGYVYAKPEYAYTPEQALEAFGTAKAADRLAEEGKALMVKICNNANAVIDALGICKVPECGLLLDFDLKYAASILSAFIEKEINGDDLQLIGERIIDAERLFNFRFGATGGDDSLPAKFLKEPIPEGPCRGQVVHLAPMLKEFYTLMGWNDDGSVSQAKQEQLGLSGLDGSAGWEELF